MSDPQCDCPMKDQVTAALTSHAKLARAFVEVDGEPDFHGHRKYHEAKVLAAEAEERFWNELRQDVIRRGILYGLLIVLGLAGIGLLFKLGLAWK